MSLTQGVVATFYGYRRGRQVKYIALSYHTMPTTGAFVFDMSNEAFTFIADTTVLILTFLYC